MKHTQEPWNVGTAAGGSVCVRENGRCNAEIAIICTAEGRTVKELKANAKLIAAAPELLDELIKAHLIINRLVEEIHKADTKSNKIVEHISWPTIGELNRKNAIAKATS